MNKYGGIIGFLTIGIFVLFLAVGERQVSTKNAEGFSVENARAHLEMIASKPRPVGSAHHKVVADYLVEQLEKLNLETTVQETAVMHSIRGYKDIVDVRNVMARLPGSGSEGALLLMAHYDSIPNSPGANDNGVAVAGILEAARVLSSGEKLKHDIIFLFTDAEELGLYGAEAFIKEHPWANSVGLTLNFDSQGNAGPVYLFETSSGNRWLIKEMAKALPNAIGFSLAEDLYKLLPHQTDFSVIKEAGHQGANFANTIGTHYYHSSLDKLDSVDEGTLLEKGVCALSGARHFGNIEWAKPSKSNSVFFSVPLLGMIKYAKIVDLIMLVCAFGLLIASCMRMKKSDEFSIRGLFGGFLTTFACLIGGPLLTFLLVKLLAGMIPYQAYNLIGQPYQFSSMLAGLVLIGIGSSFALFGLFRKRCHANHVATGGLLLWALSATAAVLVAPGTAFLLTGPLFFFAAGLLIVSRSDWADGKKASVMLLFLIPLVVIWVPVIKAVFSIISFQLTAVGILLVTLMVSLFQQPFLLAYAGKVRFGALALLLVGGGIFLQGLSASGKFNQTMPKRNSLFYAADADGASHWYSTDNKPDKWTAQFFDANTKRARLRPVFPDSDRTFMRGPAPPINQPHPEITVLEDETAGGFRNLALHIASYRGAETMRIFFEGEILEAGIGDIRLEAGLIRLRYFAMPETGVVLHLTTDANSTAGLTIMITDISYGYPQELMKKPRPEDFTSASYFGWYQDSIMLYRTYTF